MASSYPQELMDTALDILYGAKPETQATLRRAVSTAYYALFHLLVGEACKLWGVDEQRGKLARQFDHRPMKEASTAIKEKFKKEAASNQFPYEDLHTVSSAFVQLSNTVNPRTRTSASHSRPTRSFTI
jgi:hypothetical protein